MFPSTQKKNPEKRLSVIVPDKFLKTLTEFCKEVGDNKSNIVRRAVEHYQDEYWKSRQKELERKEDVKMSSRDFWIARIKKNSRMHPEYDDFCEVDRRDDSKFSYGEYVIFSSGRAAITGKYADLRDKDVLVVAVDHPNGSKIETPWHDIKNVGFSYYGTTGAY